MDQLVADQKPEMRAPQGTSATPRATSIQRAAASVHVSEPSPLLKSASHSIWNSDIAVYGSRHAAPLKPPAPSSHSRTPATAAAPHLEHNINPVKVYGKFREPVKYGTSPGNPTMVGSRAYYRSWAYKKKKIARIEKEAAELGPLLRMAKKKAVKNDITNKVGRRKVDERWRRYLGRLEFLENL